MSSYIAIDDIKALEDEFKLLKEAKAKHDKNIAANKAYDKLKHESTLFDNDELICELDMEATRLQMDKEHRDETARLKAEIQKYKEERAGIKSGDNQSTSSAPNPTHIEEPRNPLAIVAMICIALVIIVGLAS